MKLVKLSFFALGMGLFVASCSGGKGDAAKTDSTTTTTTTTESTPPPAATDTMTAGAAKPADSVTTTTTTTTDKSKMENKDGKMDKMHSKTSETTTEKKAK